jgi:hypothetical protein
MTDELLVGRHLRFGWSSLLVFLTLGLGLELLHGFKVRWYLDAAFETRRLLLTLAHAHGVLLALIHIGFAASVAIRPQMLGTWQRWVSAALISASGLLPGGFLLGGLVVHGGDPGGGVLLVPLGGLLLFASVARIAWAIVKGGQPRPAASPGDGGER